MKNRFKALIALVITIVLLWSAAWGVGAYIVNDEAEKFFAQNAEPRVTCNQFSVTGYPFRYDLYCGDGSITIEDTNWSFKGVKAAARIYSPTHLVGFLEGPFIWSDEFTGSQRELGFSDAQWSVRLSWQLELERISLVANKLSWTDNLLGRFELANAEKFEAHLIAPRDRDDGVQAFVRATNTNLLELDVLDTDATLEVDGEKLTRNLLNWQNPNLLRDWQQLGGKLLVNKFDVKARNLQITAEGAVTLDENGLLNGAITTQSKGLVERFDPESYGILAPTIFGVADGDGNYKSHWRATAGAVSVGVAPLFYVPALF